MLEEIQIQKDYFSFNTIPETRGFYLQLSAKSTEMEIISNIQSFKNAGFNTIFLDVYNDGYTIYKSNVMKSLKLPAINPVFSKLSLLESVFSAALNENLKVYANIDILNAGDRSITKTGPIIRKKKTWALRNQDGDISPIAENETNVFLCPANHDVRNFLGSLSFEILDEFPFYGIVVDMSDFPYWEKIDDDLFQTGCHCENCVNELENRFKISYNEIEENVSKEMLDSLKLWRKECLTDLMMYITMRLRKSRRPLHIILKVPGGKTNKPEYSEAVYLWRTWLQSAIFNEIILDKYPDKEDEFREKLSGDITALFDNSMILPLINTEDTSEMQALILATREYPVAGFVYRNPQIFKEPDLDKIHEVLKDPADQVEYNGLKSIAQHALRLIGMTYNYPDLFDFFQDFVKFVEIEGHTINMKRIENMIENINSVERHIQRYEFEGEIHSKIHNELSLIRRILYFRISSIMH